MLLPSSSRSDTCSTPNPKFARGVSFLLSPVLALDERTFPFCCPSLTARPDCGKFEFGRGYEASALIDGRGECSAAVGSSRATTKPRDAKATPAPDAANVEAVLNVNETRWSAYYVRHFQDSATVGDEPFIH